MVWRSSEGWSGDVEKKPVATIIKAVVIATLVIVGLTALIWGLATGFSYWKGKGDAYQEKNSAQNWVAAQRAFHQESNDYTADLAKISGAAKALAAFEAKPHPDADTLSGYQWQQEDTNLTGTVTGLVASCHNLVSSYNTDAESYLTSQFRDADLPATLDDSACDSADK